MTSGEPPDSDAANTSAGRGAGLVASAQPQPHERGRVDALTGLRLLAALLVVLSHFPMVPGGGAVNVFLKSGYNGVTLFFVLSGFVLAWNYSSMVQPTWTGTWDFFVARVARVYPLYLTALAAVLVLTRPWPDWRLVGLHAAALQTWMPRLDHAFALNGPGWSIGVEFFLYDCFPVVIILVTRITALRGRVLLAGVAVLALAAVSALFGWTPLGDLPWNSPYSAHRWLYRTPLTRLPDFVVGAVLARIVVNSWTTGAGRVAAHTQWASMLVIGALMVWAPLQYSA